MITPSQKPAALQLSLMGTAKPVICNHHKDMAHNMIWMNADDMVDIFGSDRPMAIQRPPFIQVAGHIWQVAKKAFIERGEIGITSLQCSDVSKEVSFFPAFDIARDPQTIKQIFYEVFEDTDFKSRHEAIDKDDFGRRFFGEYRECFFSKNQIYVHLYRGQRFFVQVKKTEPNYPFPAKLGLHTEGFLTFQKEKLKINPEKNPQKACPPKSNTSIKFPFWCFPNETVFGETQHRFLIEKVSDGQNAVKMNKADVEALFGVNRVTARNMNKKELPDFYIRLAHRVFPIQLSDIRKGSIGLCDLHEKDAAIKETIIKRNSTREIVVTTAKKILQHIHSLESATFEVVSQSLADDELLQRFQKLGNLVVSKNQEILLDAKPVPDVARLKGYKIVPKIHAFKHCICDPSVLLTPQTKITLVKGEASPLGDIVITEMARQSKSGQVSSKPHAAFDAEEQALLQLEERIQKMPLAGFSQYIDILKEKIFYPLLAPKMVSGCKASKGLILYGDPGTGKSECAKQIAAILGCKESNIKLIKRSDIQSKWTGIAEQNIRKLFEHINQLKKNSEFTVLIMDEIDSFLPNRENAKEHVAGLTNEFLTWMEEDFKEKLLVIGTTNRIEAVDSAARRPGRMDILLEVKPPTKKDRCEIFKFYLKYFEKIPFYQIDAERLSERTPNFTGAAIKGVFESVIQKFNKDLIDSKIKTLKANSNADRGAEDRKEDFSLTQILHISMDYFETVIDRLVTGNESEANLSMYL